jgi:hypothetical protein
MVAFYCTAKVPTLATKAREWPKTPVEREIPVMEWVRRLGKA